jgi:hypothetical protein
MGWMVRGLNPGGGEIFRTCPDRPWSPPSLLYNGYWVYPEGQEWSRHDADPSPPSSAAGHERVELYLYSPYGPYGLYRASVPLQGWPLPSLLRIINMQFGLVLVTYHVTRLISANTTWGLMLLHVHYTEQTSCAFQWLMTYSIHILQALQIRQQSTFHPTGNIQRKFQHDTVIPKIFVLGRKSGTFNHTFNAKFKRKKPHFAPRHSTWNDSNRLLQSPFSWMIWQAGGKHICIFHKYITLSIQSW